MLLNKDGHVTRVATTQKCGLFLETSARILNQEHSTYRRNVRTY